MLLSTLFTTILCQCVRIVLTTAQQELAFHSNRREDNFSVSATAVAAEESLPPSTRKQIVLMHNNQTAIVMTVI